MYPTIWITEKGGISTFQLCAIFAVLSFLLTVIFKLRKFKNFSTEVYYIVPKLLIALGLGLGGAALFDAVVQYCEHGVFRYTGISYYGGFIIGLPALAIMLKVFRKNTSMSVMEWLNFITIPFISFHCIARFGCFLGGCCYGKVTDGPFGLLFPDVPSAGIYHHGQKVLPTNLFESCGLFLIGVILFFFVKKRRFVTYIFSYAVLRFVIEFWRGDDRGAGVGALSPSQFVSVMIVCVGIVWIAVWYILKRRKVKTASVSAAADVTNESGYAPQQNTENGVIDMNVAEEKTDCAAAETIAQANMSDVPLGEPSPQ